MSSSSSIYEEFSDSWSSSEPSLDRPLWRKQPRRQTCPPVEVVASGVVFLQPAQSPLIRGLRVKRSKIVLPNVDPKTLVRLIQHQMHAEAPLSIQKNECVSLLRLALVFDMEDVFQRVRNYVLATISGQEELMVALGQRLRSRLMVDDAFFTTLERILANLPDIPDVDQSSVQKPLQETPRPALTPLSRPHLKRLTFPSASSPAEQVPVDPKKEKRSKFNIFDLLIRPKKMLKPEAVKGFQKSKKQDGMLTSQAFKKPGTMSLQSSKQAGGVPLSQVSKKPIAGGRSPESNAVKTSGNQSREVQSQEQGDPSKKNPLALSVIRKIPRSKPH